MLGNVGRRVLDHYLRAVKRVRGSTRKVTDDDNWNIGLKELWRRAVRTHENFFATTLDPKRRAGGGASDRVGLDDALKANGLRT